MPDYNENAYEHVAACPWCGASSFRPLFSTRDWLTNKPGTFYIAECTICKVVLQHPRVKESAIGAFYTDDLGYYQAPKTVSKNKNFRRRARELFIKQALAQHFKYYHLAARNILWNVITAPFARIFKSGLWPKYVPNGAVLDIGCAHGARLQKFKEYGWRDVQGLEMDSASAEYARRERGVPVEVATVEAAQFARESFDAIVMGMVLEHLYNPVEKMRLITGWLKPGGELLLCVPYFRGVEFGLFGQYTHDLHQPAHITFFDAAQLRAMLERLGYKDIKFTWHSADKNMVCSAQYAYSVQHKWWQKIVGWNSLARYLLIKPLVYIFALFGRSGRVTVTARKKA